MLQVKCWAKLHLRRPVLFYFHVLYLDHQLVRMVCRCTVLACELSGNMNKSARDGVGSQLSSSALHCQCARTRKLDRLWKYKVDTGLRKWSISPLIHSSCLHLSLRSHLQLHLSSANEDWHMVMILVSLSLLSAGLFRHDSAVFFLHLPLAESQWQQNHNVFDALQETGQWLQQNITADCFSPVVPLSCCHMTSVDREVVRAGLE